MKGKKYILLLLLIGFALILGFLARNWAPFAETLAKRPGNRSERKPAIKRLSKIDGYYDIAFLGPNNLIAVGYDGTDSKHIFSSKDGGQTWIIRDFDEVMCVVRGIHVLDARHSWAVGCTGLVFFSTDLGTSWQKVGTAGSYDLTTVKFVNTQVGYVTSGAHHACQIYRTIDGGRTWRKVFENSEGEGQAFGLTTLGDQVVLALINDEYIVRSQDGGKTWKKVESKLDGASGATFTDDGSAWLVGRRGAFFVSYDKGSTWTRPANLPASFLNHKWWSIAFANVHHGIAVGEKGIVAFTYDGGETWSEITVDRDETLSKVIIGDGKVLILGFKNLYEVSF